MSTTTSSRERVLERIRKANLRASPESQTVPRGYDRLSVKSAEEVFVLFEERLREYDAGVFAVRASDVGAKAAELLRAANRHRIVVPQGLPAEWRAGNGAAEWIEDSELTLEQLNDVDGVMTAATLGVAISGSIVLQHGAGEGRRVLTLLPDYHLCVIRSSQIVETLPEAFAKLDPALPVTFVSGPSATADIEMMRIKGVHGPRFLDVLVIVEE